MESELAYFYIITMKNSTNFKSLLFPRVKDPRYAGSTFNEKREIHHKCFCTNSNFRYYNYPVYQIIRENGGWNAWNFEVDHTFLIFGNTLKERETKKRVLEQEFFDKIGIVPKESLNWVRAFNTPEQTVEQHRLLNAKHNPIHAAKTNGVKIKCENCGKMHSTANIKQHQQTKKCLKNTKIKNNIFSK